MKRRGVGGGESGVGGAPNARNVSAGVADDLRAAEAELGVPLSPDRGTHSPLPTPHSRLLRFTGRVDRLSAEDRRALCERTADDGTDGDVAARARWFQVVPGSSSSSSTWSVSECRNDMSSRSAVSS